jgi:hypothetical protein
MYKISYNSLNNAMQKLKGCTRNTTTVQQWAGYLEVSKSYDFQMFLTCTQLNMSL